MIDLPYSLLAFDYDGTAGENGMLPTPRVRLAIASAQERGVHAVLATGRSYVSGRRYAEALGLHDPLIVYQGALVREMNGTRKTLLLEPFPEALLPEMFGFSKVRNLEMNLYTEKVMYVVGMRHDRAFYERWFSLNIREVGSVDEALGLMAEDGQVPVKFMFIGEPHQNEEILGELKFEFGDRLSAVRSHPLFLEVTSPLASKGNALAFLAGHLGVKREQVMAVGDSGNDISMIRWAALGVAMGNASADVKEAADWLAPGISDDGLAVAIEQLVLNGAGG